MKLVINTEDANSTKIRLPIKYVFFMEIYEQYKMIRNYNQMYIYRSENRSFFDVPQLQREADNTVFDDKKCVL